MSAAKEHITELEKPAEVFFFSYRFESPVLANAVSQQLMKLSQHLIYEICVHKFSIIPDPQQDLPTSVFHFWVSCPMSFLLHSQGGNTFKIKL